MLLARLLESRTLARIFVTRQGGGIAEARAAVAVNGARRRELQAAVATGTRPADTAAAIYTAVTQLAFLSALVVHRVAAHAVLAVTLAAVHVGDARVSAIHTGAVSAGAVRADAGAAVSVRVTIVAIWETTGAVADEVSVLVRRAQAAAALIGDGARHAVVQTLVLVDLVAKATEDAEVGLPTGLIAAAAVVGPGEAAIADLARRFGAVDRRAATNLTTREQLADAGVVLRVAGAKAVAALPVLRAQLTEGPASAQVVAAAEPGSVVEARIGAAVGGLVAGLTHDTAAHRTLTLDLGAEAVLAEPIAAVGVVAADLPGRAAQPPGDASHSVSELGAGAGAAVVVGVAALAGDAAMSGSAAAVGAQVGAAVGVALTRIAAGPADAPLCAGAVVAVERAAIGRGVTGFPLQRAPAAAAKARAVAATARAARRARDAVRACRVTDAVGH